MHFQPKNFLKNSSVALAMVMATIGLKIPIRPIPRQNPEQVLDIRDSEGRSNRVEIPLSLNKVIIFTLGATLTRHHHFLVTPSIRIVNFFKEAMRSLLSRRNQPTNLLDFTSNESQNPRPQNTNPGLVDVESFDISSEIANQITNNLALYGPSFPEDAKKVESAIRLDDPVFVASLDTLLKGHACNLSTEQVLEYISMALHPTPKSHGTTAPIKLSEVLRRDLRQFKVFHKRHNLFAHVRAMAEGMGLHHRHSN